MVIRRIDVIPVLLRDQVERRRNGVTGSRTTHPIVTENHDGEKFLTTLRHPTSYFDCGASVDSEELGSSSGASPAGSPARSEADADIVGKVARVFCRLAVEVRESTWAAGIVMAGLLDAICIRSWLVSAMTLIKVFGQEEVVRGLEVGSSVLHCGESSSL